MESVAAQRAPIVIDNVDDARTWVLLAFGAYVRTSLGGEVTVDFRKIQTYMERHPKEFPVRISDYGDGRIIGMVLNEMADVHVIEPLKETRANGGVLYQVTRAKPHRPRAGEVMVKTDMLISPEYVIRGIGDKKLIQMMGSITVHGLQVPLLCRPAGSGRIQVVDGNRRFNAIKALGTMPEIPCIVKEMDDRTAYELAGVANFEIKTMEPIEEAHYFKKYIEMKWGDVKYLAKRFSKDEGTIRERLALLDTPIEFQDALVKDKIWLKVADQVAEVLEQTKDPERKEELREQTKEMMSMFNQHELPLSKFSSVLSTMVEKKLPPGRALEMINERESGILQTNQTMLTQFLGEPKVEFRCPGCSNKMMVDWDMKAVFDASHPHPA